MHVKAVWNISKLLLEKKTVGFQTTFFRMSDIEKFSIVQNSQILNDYTQSAIKEICLKKIQSKMCKSEENVINLTTHSVCQDLSVSLCSPFSLFPFCWCVLFLSVLWFSSIGDLSGAGWNQRSLVASYDFPTAPWFPPRLVLSDSEWHSSSHYQKTLHVYFIVIQKS